MSMSMSKRLAGIVITGLLLTGTFAISPALAITTSGTASCATPKSPTLTTKRSAHGISIYTYHRWNVPSAIPTTTKSGTTQTFASTFSGNPVGYYVASTSAESWLSKSTTCSNGPIARIAPDAAS